MKDVIRNGRVQESIRRFRCSFLQSGRETLFNVLPAQELMRVVQEEVERRQDRLYAPLVVQRLFVEQVLHAEHACQDVVVRYASERVAQNKQTGEDALARRSYGSLVKGDSVLADRYHTAAILPWQCCI